MKLLRNVIIVSWFCGNCSSKKMLCRFLFIKRKMFIFVVDSVSLGHSLNIFTFDRTKLVSKSTITKLLYCIFLIQVTKISIFDQFEPTKSWFTKNSHNNFLQNLLLTVYIILRCTKHVCWPQKNSHSRKRPMYSSECLCFILILYTSSL